MTTRSPISKMDILYFNLDEGRKQRCHLKNFINFLIGNGVRRPIKFAHIEEEGNLLGNMSLRENIYLDSVPNSLSTTKDFQLAEYLEKTGNTWLLKLYNKITLLDEVPDNVDDQTRKITALIKGLIQRADYLFLESPEKYLSRENTELFIRAMEYQTANNGLIVLIRSDNEKLWAKHISKMVTRGPQQEYRITPAGTMMNVHNLDAREAAGSGQLAFLHGIDKKKRAA